MNNLFIPRCTTHKHLGLILDSTLSFEHHLTHVITKCNILLNPLKSLKTSLQSSHLEKNYFSILPHLEYCSIIFDSANMNILSRLDQIHYHAALIVSGCIWGTSCENTFKCLGWMTLEQRRRVKKMVLMFDVENNNLPKYVNDNCTVFKNPEVDNRLRNQRPYILPSRMSLKFRKSTVASAISIWCSLPIELKNRYSRNSFKYHVRLHLKGNITNLVSTRLQMPRNIEFLLNRTRCDLIFKSHFYNHNFTNMPDPTCNCGYNGRLLNIYFPMPSYRRSLF